MKTKKYILPLALVGLLGGLTSCYRDDINYLYSEQYINDGNRELILHPLQAKYSNDFGHYDEQTNTLYVTPESTVELPYTKKGDLPRILATLPSSWSHSIDYEKKIITLHTPKFQSFVKEANDEGFTTHEKELFGATSLLFTSRTKRGITFSQEIKAVIPDRIYAHLFHRRKYSPVEENRLYDDLFFNEHAQFNDPLDVKTLTGKRYNVEFHIGSGDNKHFRDTLITKTPEQLLSYLNQPIQADFLSYKPSRKLEDVYQVSYVYDTDSTSTYKFVSENAPAYWIGPKAGKNGKPELLQGPELSTNLPENQRPLFVHPIAWNSFATPSKPFFHHEGPIAYRRPIERITDLTQLELRNPHRYFGLDASETFDASKVVLYTGTDILYGPTSWTDFLPEYKNRMFLVKAENACSYDKAKDLLSGAFTSLPMTNTESSELNSSLIIEYTKANGKKVYKFVQQEPKDGLYGDFLKPIKGGWRKFVIDANAGKEATSHAEVMQLAPGYRYTTVQINKVPVSSSVLDHKTPKFGYDIYDNEQ